jgi:hypothetical protein
MFAKIPYFFKQRNFIRRSRGGNLPDKRERRMPPEIYRYLRSGNASKRKIRRYAGPSFVKACSYQSTERAAITDEEVRARRGTTRNRCPQIVVDAECNEALP